MKCSNCSKEWDIPVFNEKQIKVCPFCGTEIKEVNGYGLSDKWVTEAVGWLANAFGVTVEKDSVIDNNEELSVNNYGISSPRIENGVTTWDKIQFGEYYQNGRAPIEWRVLSVDGDDAFLLADKNLDCQLYHNKDEMVTWETCSLRKWLNSNFYNAAFDGKEKKAIIETTVINNANPKYEADGGNNTMDKVYLLSIEEVVNRDYGFENRLVAPYIERFMTREAKNTTYASAKRGSGFSALDDGYWWLRSPGYFNNYAAYVSYSGLGYDTGIYIDRTLAVRPTLHINLSSSVWSKAGEVTARRISANA